MSTFHYYPLDETRRKRITYTKNVYYVDTKRIPSLRYRLNENNTMKKRKKHEVGLNPNSTVSKADILALTDEGSKIRSAFVVWKWTLVETNILLFDESINMAMTIHIIVKNNCGVLLPVMITRSRNQGQTIVPPFQFHGMCLHNQVCFKMGVGCVLLKKNHKWDAFNHAYVIGVDDSGVQRWKLPEWVITHQKEIYDTLT